jgi:Glu-tRNA(Gln) amidotransferase subunit E-like FAD-binding protein
MRLMVMLSGADGRYAAAAPGLPGCSATGRTRSEALANLRALVRRRGGARDGAALFLRGVLERHGQRTLERSEPVDVRLSGDSRIVRRNGGMLRCVRYRGLAGLFRKDEALPWRFGRSMCDHIRREFASDGFFTTDELPGYGIGPTELAAIRAATGAGPGDLVVLYAYPAARAARIDDAIFDRLRRLLAPSPEPYAGDHSSPV